MANHMYAAGLVSLGLSLVHMGMSEMEAENSRAQADRWGLFVGEWAPISFAMGSALGLEKQGGLPHRDKG